MSEQHHAAVGRTIFKVAVKAIGVTASIAAVGALGMSNPPVLVWRDQHRQRTEPRQTWRFYVHGGVYFTLFLQRSRIVACLIYEKANMGYSEGNKAMP